MQELLALYRFALRAGDRSLAEALGRAMRSDARLERLERGQARPSAAAERAVNAALTRLGSMVP
jgi:hypothetical protein